MVSRKYLDDTQVILRWFLIIVRHSISIGQASIPSGQCVTNCLFSQFIAEGKLHSARSWGAQVSTELEMSRCRVEKHSSCAQRVIEPEIGTRFHHSQLHGYKGNNVYVHHNEDDKQSQGWFWRMVLAVIASIWAPMGYLNDRNQLNTLEVVNRIRTLSNKYQTTWIRIMKLSAITEK